MIGRLMFLAVFFCFMPFTAVVMVLTVLAAGLGWLVGGGSAANWILMNPVLGYLVEYPFEILEGER